MSIIAVIPARSGSKGVKNKNIRELNGIPLMGYSIEVARQANIFDEIIVSTDSTEYAVIARKLGAQVPFLRTYELSNDEAQTLDVVRDTILQYEKMGKSFDSVMILQPTSPLRSKEDILGAVDIMRKKTAEIVVSICEAEHSPLWSNILTKEGTMDKFYNNSKNNKPRQQLEKYYRINGAIYLVNIKHLMTSNNEMFYKTVKCHPFIMPCNRSVDIDEELDFIIAESIIKYFDKCKGE